MKISIGIFLLFFLSGYLLAQKDTTYEGHIFHVILYDDSGYVACIGNYIPNTAIRTGEWDYFYHDGKLYSRTYFEKDLKRGLWIYYDENGNITRDEKHKERLEPKVSPLYNYPDIDQLFATYYRNAQQNKNACIQFSHGIEPLEYDEKLYPFKVNAIALTTYNQRTDTDAKECKTRYYRTINGKSYLKETNGGKQYTNIEVKNGRAYNLNSRIKKQQIKKQRHKFFQKYF